MFITLVLFLSAPVWGVCMYMCGGIYFYIPMKPSYKLEPELMKLADHLVTVCSALFTGVGLS